MSHFMIICAPRTGSSHLVATLSGHPDIFANGNIFDKDHVYVFWPKADLTQKKKAELFHLRETDPQAFLQLVLANNFGKPNNGFKIFQDENDQILDALIADTSTRKVVLFRRNILAMYSSSLLARRSREYSVKEGLERNDVNTVHFNPEKFVHYHNKYVGFTRGVLQRLHEKDQEFYLFAYEDINDPLLLGGLIKFIGADPRKSIVKEEQYKSQIKQNSSNIISRFSNPAFVKKFLENRGFLHWGYEGNIMLNDLEKPNDGKVSA